MRTDESGGNSDQPFLKLCPSVFHLWQYFFRIFPIIACVSLCLAAESCRRSSGPQKVDLKAIGDFDFDGENGTIDDVPWRFRKLDGQRVTMDGFMWAPSSSGWKVRDFQFVYDITNGGHTKPPQVQNRVFCHVVGAEPFPYYNDFAQITGILHVRVDRVNGKVMSVFSMDADSAKTPPDDMK